MDPISAAGIGLSVVSLALQVFAGCVKCYEMYIRIDGMPDSLAHLRIALSLEQARFLSWGEKMGLVEELLDKPSIALQLHKGLILDTLFQIQKLFRGCLDIQSDFEETLTVEEWRQGVKQRTGKSRGTGTDRMKTKNPSDSEQPVGYAKACTMGNYKWKKGSRSCSAIS